MINDFELDEPALLAAYLLWCFSDDVEDHMQTEHKFAILSYLVKLA